MAGPVFRRLSQTAIFSRPLALRDAARGEDRPAWRWVHRAKPGSACRAWHGQLGPAPLAAGPERSMGDRRRARPSSARSLRGPNPILRRLRRGSAGRPITAASRRKSSSPRSPSLRKVRGGVPLVQQGRRSGRCGRGLQRGLALLRRARGRKGRSQSDRVLPQGRPARHAGSHGRAQEPGPRPRLRDACLRACGHEP